MLVPHRLRSEVHSNLCLLKQMCSILNWFALYAGTKITGNPEQIADAWLKPGLKIDKRPEDDLIHTQFTGGWGGGKFAFSSSLTQERSHREYICCCHTALLIHMKVNKTQVTAILTWIRFKNLPRSPFGSFLQLYQAGLGAFFPSPGKCSSFASRIVKELGAVGKALFNAPSPEVQGQLQRK